MANPSRFDMKDARSITSYADDLEDFWDPRNVTMRNHQDLYQLQPTVQAEARHERLTENRPMVVVDYAANVIATRQPQHRIPYEYGPRDNPQREARSGQLERYLIGCWQEVGKEQTHRRRGPFHLELAHYAALRGWVAGVVAWTGEGKLPYHIRLWDPYHVFPDPDIPDIVIRRYRRSVASVLDEYPSFKNKLKGKELAAECDVVDLWLKTEHATVIDGEWAKKPTPHGLDHNPVICLPVGGYPVRSITSRRHSDSHASPLGDNTWVEFVGRGILAPVYELQKYSNLISSQVADVFSQYAEPIPVSNTENGTAIDVTLGDSIGLGLQEKLSFLRPPGLPGDLAAWMGRINNMLENGTFPGVMLGMSPQELSGFARAMVHNAGIMRVTPLVFTCESFYEMADALMLEELEKNAADERMLLRGQDNEGKKFSEEVDLYELRQVVAGDYEVEVEIKPYLPQDRMAAVQMGQVLHQSRQWSRKTINERLHADDVQDAVGEDQRIRDEMMGDNPKALEMVVTALAPISASRELRMLFDRKRITEAEYQMGMDAIRNQVRVQKGAERQLLAEIEGGPGAANPPGLERGPRGSLQPPADFPMGQNPQPSELPPETLAPQLQGSASPPGRGEF